jgi:hypothetical protein
MTGAFMRPGSVRISPTTCRLRVTPSEGPIARASVCLSIRLPEGRADGAVVRPRIARVAARERRYASGGTRVAVRKWRHERSGSPARPRIELVVPGRSTPHHPPRTHPAEPRSRPSDADARING